MTPSQQIIATSNPTEDVTDSRGRILQVRRTTVLETRRLTRACGAAADIDRWYGEAVLAAQVRAIDNKMVVFPNSADAADQLVATLDADGLTAVAQWLERGAEVPQTDPQSSPPTQS